MNYSVLQMTVSSVIFISCETSAARLVVKMMMYLFLRLCRTLLEITTKKKRSSSVVVLLSSYMRNRSEMHIPLEDPLFDVFYCQRGKIPRNCRKKRLNDWRISDETDVMAREINDTRKTHCEF